MVKETIEVVSILMSAHVVEGTSTGAVPLSPPRTRTDEHEDMHAREDRDKG
jgi:hypothetical protein